VKPGVKTTEWWTTLALIALNALVALGILAPSESSQIQTEVGQIGDALVRIVASVASLIAVIRYAAARTSLKSKGEN